MGAKAFEELRVYQQAEELADLVWDIVLAWQVLAKETVGRQMIRAADSIGANIAEGHGRGSYQDNRRYVRIARGSLYETRHWLRRAYRRKLLSDEQVQKLKPIVENLGPQLRQAQAAGRALEKPDAQLILELGDPPADARYRHLQAPGRLGEAIGLDDLRKHHQGIEVHHRLSGNRRRIIRYRRPADKQAPGPENAKMKKA